MVLKTKKIEARTKSDRITEYADPGIIDELIPQTELPKQPEFYKIPSRFGSIPVDELPLGCDAEKQYYKPYPMLKLPLQKADRVTFGHSKLDPNRLIWGDNLHVMRILPSNSIDLIYIDPPFFSGRKYNVIFGDKNETRSFTDIWEGGMSSYLIWLNARIIEMKRLLKPTGSFFMHLDWHAAHYVKVQLDKIFGYDNFRNEIFVPRIRKNVKEYATVKKLNVGVDVILFYAKTDKVRITLPTKIDKKPERWHGFDAPELRKGMDYTLFGHRPPTGGHWRWTEERSKKAVKEGMLRPNPKTGKPEYKIKASDTVTLSNLWDDVNAYQFKIGYPTEKNEKLIERILEMATTKGQVVADFFSGGGSTPAAAQRLGRRWIACDQSRVAIAITQSRLESLYEEGDGNQHTLEKIPDMSIECWGTYEMPALENKSNEEFRDFIISAYGGRATTTGNLIHGFKKDTPLFVGPAKQRKRITKKEVIEFAREVAITKGKKHGTMIAWAFAPSARDAAYKLTGKDNPNIDLIQITLTEIKSSEFKKHVTKLNSNYNSFLVFIMPPEVVIKSKKLENLKYEFDASESMTMNVGARIINVQWDFNFRGRFTPSKGFAFGRNKKDLSPLFNVEYKFNTVGKVPIACRVQDDLGGEKIHTEIILVS